MEKQLLRADYVLRYALLNNTMTTRKGTATLPEPREKAVTIRMSEDEVSMLRAVADAKGLSVSDVVRQFVRREHAKLSKRGEA
jgi:hypothetical protein